MVRRPALRFLALAVLAATSIATQAAPVTLLNVSYDVAREFYKDYDAAFIAHWKQAGGEAIVVNQSHGGSSKQARSVLDGLEADVVTMNQATDIDVLADRGQLIPASWATRLPNHSAPTTSVPVILVKKGNPKGLHDWADLARGGVSVVIPNPKTSGNGRYTYLAAWGSVVKAGGTPAQARELVARMFGNVPVFDGGGRAATTTFAQRGIGDALVTFENEVSLIASGVGAGTFEAVYPSVSLLAAPPVSIVDKVVDKRGTRKEAQAYLDYLWSPAAQEIIAQHHLRPRNADVLAKHASEFRSLKTFTVEQMFGSWQKAQQTHFSDGGSFDQAVADKN
jgi:sulfate transport system substrate-binding protein